MPRQNDVKRMGYITGCTASFRSLFQDGRSPQKLVVGLIYISQRRAPPTSPIRRSFHHGKVLQLQC